MLFAENRLAFFDQIAHSKLMAAGAQCCLNCADQRKAAQGAPEECDIRVRAEQIPNATVCIVRLAPVRQNKQRQVGPRRLRAQAPEDPRNLPTDEVFLRLAERGPA